MSKPLTIIEEYISRLDSETMYLWEERSSIIENCSGLARELANALAILITIGKHPELLLVNNNQTVTMTTDETVEQCPWPLEGTRLIAVFKVDGCDVYHHTNENPYYQISVSGLVLDCFGKIAFADIEFNADEGDPVSAIRLEKQYGVGTLHWLDSTLFDLVDGEFHFYGPETTPVPCDKFDAINDFFINPRHF